MFCVVFVRAHTYRRGRESTAAKSMEKGAAEALHGGATKDSAKPEARVVPNAALRQPQQQGPSLSQSAAQWDRFEVALSKPSGRQKLGMVLKHAQVMYNICT